MQKLPLWRVHSEQFVVEVVAAAAVAIAGIGAGAGATATGSRGHFAPFRIVCIGVHVVALSLTQKKTPCSPPE